VILKIVNAIPAKAGKALNGRQIRAAGHYKDQICLYQASIRTTYDRFHQFNIYRPLKNGFKERFVPTKRATAIELLAADLDDIPFSTEITAVHLHLIKPGKKIINITSLRICPGRFRYHMTGNTLPTAFFHYLITGFLTKRVIHFINESLNPSILFLMLGIERHNTTLMKNCMGNFRYQL